MANFTLTRSEGEALKIIYSRRRKKAGEDNDEKFLNKHALLLSHALGVELMYNGVLETDPPYD